MKLTNRISNTWRLEQAVYGLLAAASLFLLAVYYINAHHSKVSTSPAVLVLISFSVALPELIIWFIAAVGALKFKRYATGIKHSKDGAGLNDIATALVLLVAYVVLFTASGPVRIAFKHAGCLSPVIFLTNVVPVVIALASSIYLFKGSLHLSQLVPLDFDSAATRWGSIVWIVILALFAWDFYSTLPHLAPQNGVPRFSLDRNVLIFIYVLPLSIIWSLALIACLTIANYAHRTKGTIYRALLSDLYKGVLLVYLCTFLAQFFVLSNVNFQHFGLGVVLIYGVLLLTVWGFVLIYRGACKLQRLEEI